MTLWLVFAADIKHSVAQQVSTELHGNGIRCVELLLSNFNSNPDLLSKFNIDAETRASIERALRSADDYEESQVIGYTYHYTIAFGLKKKPASVSDRIRSWSISSQRTDSRAREIRNVINTINDNPIQISVDSNDTNEK